MKTVTYALELMGILREVPVSKIPLRRYQVILSIAEAGRPLSAGEVMDRIGGDEQIRSAVTYALKSGHIEQADARATYAKAYRLTELGEDEAARLITAGRTAERGAG